MARPWKEQDGALRKMWAAGDTSKVIGKRLGRTAGAVRNRAKMLGLPPRDSSTTRVATQADWTDVKVKLSDELLPPKRLRGVVIREGLELRLALRAAGFEGTPAELGAWLEARR